MASFWALFLNIRFISTVTVLTFISATLRLLAVLPPRKRPSRRNNAETAHLMILLGSGGHTAEMLSLLSSLNPLRYNSRIYVIGSGDTFSETKAVDFEARLLAERARKTKGVTGSSEMSSDSPKKTSVGSYMIVTVPRARHIHQSIYTTPFTALQTLYASLHLLLGLPSYPNVILTNGPGTAVLLVLASVLLRFTQFRGANKPENLRTIYIESWARVKKLSLTGVLLSRIVDRLLVQWEALDGVAGRGEFRGVLIK